MEQSEQTLNSKKYKYTKQIIRIAIEHGYTNQQIAKKAGLNEKSIALVSKWRNGKALATERQMQALINEFGAQLKRQVQHLLAFAQDGTQRFTVIEGDVLLKHTVRISTEHGKIAVFRVLLFKVGDKFTAVTQQRYGLNTNEALNPASLAHSDNEDAHWLSLEFLTSKSTQHVITYIDDFVSQIDQYNNQLDAQTHERKVLGYKLRQALMREGYCVEDIVTLDLSKYEIQNTAAQ